MARNSVLEEAMLLARRQDEDERLIEAYAAGEGRGRDIRPVRDFVRHVRRDVGPRAVISKVALGEPGSGDQVVAWYFFPEDGDPATAATPAARPDVKDVPTQASIATSALANGVRDGSRQSVGRQAAAPASVVRRI